MTRIVIRSSFGPELEVEQAVFNNGFYPGYSYVRDAGGSTGPYVPPWEDADLAAVVANSGSAVRAALAAVPVTDSQLPSRLSDVSLKAAYVPRWQPSTAYTQGQAVLNPSGQIVTANAAFTSGTTYSAANWTVTSGGGGTVSDATSSAKGIVQLAGDLGGTAAAPTVPGLAAKVNVADVNQAVTAADIPFVPAAGIAATNVQAAVAEAVTDAATAYSRKPVFLSAYQSVPTANSTSGNIFTFRATHTLTQAVAGFRLVMPLGFNISSGITATDVLWTGSTPVKVSVEIAGAIRPVTWQATRVKTADPGGVLVSDLIAADLPAGTQVPVRVMIPTSTLYPNTIGTGQGPGATASGDGYSNSADISDAMTTPPIANTAGYFAHGLVGLPAGTPKPAVAFIGDSITAGIGDATLNGGWTAYASNATVPNLRLAVSGAAAQGWVGAHTYSWPYLDYCSHAIVLLGANDLTTTNGPRTLAQFQADLTSIYTAMKNRGLKVYGCTVLPRTSSTDSWATTTNQTPQSTAFAAGGSSVRGQINAWIRGKAGGLLDGYFETADPVESARDSGLWKANYTTDGAHPTLTAHQAMAAAVNLTTLA